MLVFSVQPMLGKMMLPHVGGAPSGWAVTMFFFQTCLLFGYGLAYLFSKLPPIINAAAILLVFAPAALFLPIAYKSSIVDSISPWAVFLQLTASTAVPFLALSTLSPGLQRLFSYSHHRTADDPYYLYAASNLGSFFGLLAYPIIFEPILGLQTQSELWMMGFGVLFFCVLMCAIIIFSTRPSLITLRQDKLTKQEDTEHITWPRRFKWLMLAAIPSSLMIGTTTEITTDIASAPMIWVLPLGLYLMTTIVAFAKRNEIETDFLATLHMIAVITIGVILILENYGQLSAEHTYLIALAYIIIFTLIVYLLHSLLANDRPAANRLTEFYLIMALGGALGGSFNAFIAPNIFNDVYEFQFVIALSLFFNPVFKQALPVSFKKLALYAFGLFTLALILISFKQGTLFISFLMFSLFLTSIHIRVLLPCFIALIIFLASPLNSKNLIHIDRNFFGVVKVEEREENKAKTRAMMHGTTLHGFESLDKEYAYRPSSYYGVKGPLGDVINTNNPNNIAALGLGVGQIACYQNKEITFYEIDPHVVDVALNKFTVLKTCGYKDIILGDARLELTKDQDKYDLIVVDTFSSDSIPVHLITKEAITLYADKTTQNGAIIINISNRHLDLTKPLATIAENTGLAYRSKFYAPPKENIYDTASHWFVMTLNQDLIRALDTMDWKTNPPKGRLWTDDYSNLLSTLKIFNKSKKETKTEE